MALPVIIYNNSTGSDTQASGAGPATAVYGTNAAHTNGGASTTITLTNSPDLSGVVNTGAHALYLNTGSGRKWTKITGVDDVAKTVTVEDSFNIAAGSAVNYAIGGKRNSIDTTDFKTNLTGADLKAGWTVQIEYTGSTYTITGQVNCNSVAGDGTSGWITIIGTGASKPTISYNQDNTLFSASKAVWWFENLILINTNASKTASNAIALGNNVSPVVYKDLVIQDWYKGLYVGLNDQGNIINCEVSGCTFLGIDLAGQTDVVGCYVHDNPGDGIKIGPLSIITRSLIVDNGGYGIYASVSGTYAVILYQNTIANNGSDGIFFTMNATGLNLVFANNLVYGNGGYGISCTGTYATAGGCDAALSLNSGNAFGGNTPSARNIWPVGLDEVTVTNDPFTDSSTRDYRLNTDISGGVLCKSAGVPLTINGISNYAAIGTYEAEEETPIAGMAFPLVNREPISSFTGGLVC